MIDFVGCRFAQHEKAKGRPMLWATVMTTESASILLKRIGKWGPTCDTHFCDCGIAGG